MGTLDDEEEGVEGGAHARPSSFIQCEEVGRRSRRGSEGALLRSEEASLQWERDGGIGGTEVLSAPK